MAERVDSSHPDATTEEPHRHERPEDWGWNGSWGKWARIGAWISVVVLLIGLAVGAVVAVVAIFVAFRIWLAQPGTAARIRERVPALYTFLYNKWYFDEAIDFLFVRPALTVGRFAGSVLERTVIEGVLTGGAVGAVRVGSAAVRRWQTGFLRYYAAAMVICLSGVALYFLISS